MVFLVLFSLPFCGFGLFAIAMGIRELSKGNTGAGIGLTLFGVVFGGVGFGVLYAGIRGRKAVAKSDEVRAQNPDAPWLWREDWASGRIKCSSKGALTGAWVFAVLWNAISWPVVFAFPKELDKGNHAIWIALIFPAIGIGLLAWAVRATIRWRKFGESAFVLGAVPGVIGGTLSGAIHPGTGLRLMQEFRLRLTCVNRVTTGSGKNRSTSEHVLWQDEKQVNSDFNGLVPVSFLIPDDSRESDNSDSDNAILWRLESMANVPGVDYLSSFEVPVFRVAQTAEQLAHAESARREKARSLGAYQRPAGSPIVVRSALHGGTEFLYPPGRNPGAALVLTLFTLLWTGSIVFMVWKKAPWFFPVVFGLFDLLLIYGMLHTWFGSTRVLVRTGRVEVTNRLFGIGSPKTMAATDIVEISTRVGMTAGNRTYHDIQIHCRNGKKLVAGGAIRDKLEAEWLASEMKKQLSNA